MPVMREISCFIKHASESVFTCVNARLKVSLSYLVRLSERVGKCVSARVY